LGRKRWYPTGSSIVAFLLEKWIASFKNCGAPHLPYIGTISDCADILRKIPTIVHGIPSNIDGFSERIPKLLDLYNGKSIDIFIGKKQRLHAYFFGVFYTTRFPHSLVM